MNNPSRQLYLGRYLKVAPLSHALWRSVEAQELAKYKLERPVLDIGCGFGEFGGVFFSSSIEVGVDINEKEILQAASTGKYQKTIAVDARKLPFPDNSFSTVISISTLEHIPNNHKVFKEAYRVLKPGGKIIITVPTNQLYSSLLIVKILIFLNLKNLSHIYYRMLNKAFKHVVIQSETAWLNQVKNVGFKIEKVQGTIPQSTLILWELFLPFAIPSQVSKLLFGKRIVMAPKLKAKFFKPLTRYIRSDPSFRANILIIASK